MIQVEVFKNLDGLRYVNTFLYNMSGFLLIMHDKTKNNIKKCSFMIPITPNSRGEKISSRYSKYQLKRSPPDEDGDDDDDDRHHMKD